MNTQIEFYKPANTDYTRNGDMVLTPKSAIFTCGINEAWEVEIIEPYRKDGQWKILCGDGVVKSAIPEHEGEELFYVYDIDKGLNDIVLKCRQIFFEEINNTIADRRNVDDTGQEALDTILAYSDFNGHSDILNLNTCYYVKTNVVAAVNGDEDNTFVSRWGGEIWHNKYDLYVNKRVGQDRGVRIEYGSNLINVNLKENFDNIVTRFYPWAENDYRYSSTYIDSPLIDKYRKIKEAYIDMSDIPVKSTGNEEGYDDETVDKIMEERVAQMCEEGADKPTIEGTVEVACLENTQDYKFIKDLVRIRLGDDVTIYYRDIGIDLKARCVRYTYNLLTQKFESVEIGKVQQNFYQNQADIEHRVNNSIDNNGNVMGERVKGFLNGYEAGIKTNMEVATQEEPVIMFSEVTDINSANYGARLTTPCGDYFASTKDQYGNWQFKHAITNKGIIGDYIYGGVISSLNGVMDINMNEGNLQIHTNDQGGMLQLDKTGIKLRYGEGPWATEFLTDHTYLTVETDEDGNFERTVNLRRMKDVKVWMPHTIISGEELISSSTGSFPVAYLPREKTCNWQTYPNGDVRVYGSLRAYPLTSYGMNGSDYVPYFDFSRYCKFRLTIEVFAFS